MYTMQCLPKPSKPIRAVMLFSISSAVIQRVSPRTVLITYQTIVFILSLFRNVINKSNQIDSLKMGRVTHSVGWLSDAEAFSRYYWRETTVDLLWCLSTFSSFSYLQFYLCSPVCEFSLTAIIVLRKKYVIDCNVLLLFEFFCEVSFDCDL